MTTEQPGRTTLTLQDGTALTLYWSATLKAYATVPATDAAEAVPRREDAAEPYVTVTTDEGTFGVLAIQGDDGRWAANVARLGPDGGPVRTVIDEADFAADAGVYGSARDALLRAMAYVVY